MRQSLYAFILATVVIVATGCSTSSKFNIPADHTLKVTDRTVQTDASGEWKTTPFFWSTTGGAPYFLYDKNGTLVRSGTLKMNFRVASIFWPPFAIIYWPMGLNKTGYDLTKPGDGFLVRDYPAAVNGAAPAPGATTVTPVAAPAAKKKMK